MNKKTGQSRSVTDYNNQGIYLLSPQNGQIVELINDDVRTFIAGYTAGASAAYANRGDHYAPRTLLLEWSSDVAAEKFKVTVAPFSDFSCGAVYYTKNRSITLTAPFLRHTYYWKVEASIKGVAYVSVPFSFTIKELPATFFIEGVSNTRDVGGYVGYGGKKIGRGLIYRGGNLDGITENGRKFAKEVLKIRTDLDLRKADEGTAGDPFSPIGEDVSHVQASGPQYTGREGIDFSEGKQKLVAALQVFTDEQNYPVYVHCVLGRDRTGTLIAVLLALCGVSKEDILRDYELSFFSGIGCYENADVGMLIKHIADMFGYLSSFSGNTLYEKAYSFLSEAGLGKEQIGKIRSILLKDSE